MEPEGKRIKLGSFAEEVTQEKAQQESLSSIQKLQKIANDYQERYLSTSSKLEPRSEKDQCRSSFAYSDDLKSVGTSAILEQESLSKQVSLPSHSVSVGKTESVNDKNEKKTQSSKLEQRATIQNGSGQKLESIIGRLSSCDKAAPTVVDNDEEALICKADASTQTFPDFVKIVKCLVLRRMKQLEQSLIGGAVTDSVLNGKLVDLQRENRDLRKNAKKLQEKLDLIVQSLKTDDATASSKVKEVIEAVQNNHANDVNFDHSSPIRKQSAVVSPYHVQNAQTEGMITKSKEGVARSRREVIEISTPHAIAASGKSNGSVSLAIQGSQVTRHGPQIKYVPQRFHQVPHPGGPTPSQFIHLAQGGVVMQKMSMQRPRVMEHSSRPQNGQVIYTTQPVQATGPRMSTIPPQPQQANQHGSQRPIVSPSGMGTRLSQPGQLSRPGGSMLRLQGSSTQTVHYIPQNVMPYMTQIQPNVPFSGSRIVAQGQAPEIRQHLAAPPQHNIIHGELQQLHPSSNLPPPPPYQGPRVQNEQPSVQSKQHLNVNQVTRLPIEQAVPPKLQVNITVSGNGIVLSWDFEAEPSVKVPAIECYHLFASQDSPNPPTLKSEWKKIGVVKALPLPMACTLTQFVSGNSYHFAVLAVDVNGKEGPMSNPCTVRLNN